MAKKKAKAKKAKKPVKKAVKAKKPAKKKAAVKKKGAPKKKTAAKAKKSAAAAAPKTARSYQPAANERKIGKVDDFFGHIGVVALYLTDDLSVGDTIHVRGHTTDITQTVASMQINHASVQSARRGDSVGIQVSGKARKGDQVFRVG